MRFTATLRRPAGDAGWLFLLLPKDASDALPRRGRTTVAGTIHGHPFQAMLEPDGRLGHWLKVGPELQAAAGIHCGDDVALEIAPVAEEPVPEPPADLAAALAAAPAASRVWKETTAIARVDWIHWLDSAKRADTRAKRVRDACSMLAGGKKRVCCFDPSGYYSKAFEAPSPCPGMAGE